MSPTEAAVQEAVLPAGDGGSAGSCEALQSQADDSVAIFQQNWQASTRARVSRRESEPGVHRLSERVAGFGG
jgi:hypothetical protein